MNYSEKIDIETIKVNLALVLRGDVTALKRFAGLLDKYAKEMNFKVVFIKASGDRLFITKEVPKDLEDRYK